VRALAGTGRAKHQDGIIFHTVGRGASSAEG
jgi:hypothetical protein